MEKIKGVSFYPTVNVHELAGTIDTSGELPIFFGKAVLVKEPTNPYDANAVQVYGLKRDGTGHLMGHLGRDGELYNAMLNGTLQNNMVVGLRIVGYSNLGLSDSYQIELPVNTKTYHVVSIMGEKQGVHTTKVKKEIEEIIRSAFATFIQSAPAQEMDLTVPTQLAKKVDINKVKRLEFIDSTQANGLNYQSGKGEVSLQMRVDNPYIFAIQVETKHGQSAFDRPFE